MLVKELIQKLQSLPKHLQDAPVLIDTDMNICDVYTELEVQEMTLVQGKYIPSNLLYEHVRCNAPSFNAVVLELW